MPRVYMENGERTDLYSDTVRKVQELADSESLENATRACAEALADYLEKEWKKSKGVEHSSEGVSLSKLVEKNIPIEQSTLFTDHPELWMKGGKPHSYVYHNYGMSLDELRALVEFCGEHGLDAQIEASSWHFYGHTVRVELIREKREN